MTAAGTSTLEPPPANMSHHHHHHHHGESDDEEEEREVSVLYATETGNARDVAERIARLCRRLHFEVQVASLDEYEAVRVYPLLPYEVCFPLAHVACLSPGFIVLGAYSHLRGVHNRLGAGTSFDDGLLAVSSARRFALGLV